MHKSLYLIIAIGLLAFSSKAQTTINPYIGDESFFASMENADPQDFDQVFRIQTHLNYVIKKLETNRPDNLSRNQLARRVQSIENLKSYVATADFPTNYDYPNRRIQCFMDKNEKICAVGYLIFKTEGIREIERINNAFKYSTIFEIEDDSFDSWIKTNGLTKEECAMIQPTYDFMPEPIQPKPIKPITPDPTPTYDKTDFVYDIVDTLPEFIGGKAAMFHFIYNQINYPQIAKEIGVDGTVHIQFVVTTEGRVTDVIAKNKLGYKLDEEAIRVIKLTDKKWKPGFLDGTEVNSRFAIPIKYELVQ